MNPSASLDTVAQFAERVGVSTKTVYRMIWDEEIKAVRVRNTWRIDAEESLRMIGM